MEQKHRHDLAKVVLRLPEQQKRWIEEQAQINLTSMNAEIVRAIRLRMDDAASKAGIAG